METMFWVWLAVIAVTLLIEIVTLDLVSIWFSFGAVIPFILSAIGGIYIEIQISVFIVVSALLIIFVRKYAQRWLFKNMNTKTNVDSLVGKKFRLLESTDFEKNGSLKVNDVVWTAVSENGEIINQGAVVEVIKVDGNKLIVKEVESNHEKVEVNDDEKKINDNEKKLANQSEVNLSKNNVEEKQSESKNEDFKSENNIENNIDKNSGEE